jgi:hypothetical protein
MVPSICSTHKAHILSLNLLSIAMTKDAGVMTEVTAVDGVGVTTAAEVEAEAEVTMINASH